jgi:protocatechuate 4,5-dioxygenase, alpha chain
MPMMAAREAAREEAAKDYDDIPGTFVFDADRSREGYHLNMFCMSLMKAENRKAFKAHEADYLKRFPMTPEQRDAILKRDYNRMLELGGNIYFTAKLGATDGHSFQHMAAVMTGSTQEDYAKMMLAGGRAVDGNRSKSGRDQQPGARKASATTRTAGSPSAKKRATGKPSAPVRAKSSATPTARPSLSRGSKAGSTGRGRKAGSKRG